MQRLTVTTVLFLALMLGACSRQQSDWQKARETNSIEAYEQFLKRYPNGDFTAQAQVHLKDLYTERDWQKARDADTVDAYQTFITQHPEGKLADEARTRIENFNLAQAPGATPGTEEPKAAATPPRGESAAPPGAASNRAAAPASPSAAAGAGAVASAPASSGASPRPGGGAGAAAGSTAKAASGAKVAKARGGSAEGHYGVQLGAFRSGASAAHKRWERLKKDYPQLLEGLSSKVVPTRTTKGTLYRLQAVGVTERHARNICKSLRARSQACLVVHVART